METKARILYAEDDYNFGVAVKKKLEEYGFETQLITDGEIAWKMFRRNQYDICLFDVVMPKKNGFELAQQIRERNEQIPILFLTARSKDEDKITGFKHGGDAYITKPFSMQELQLRIEVFLKRSRTLNADKRTTFTVGEITFDYGELKLMDSSGQLKASLTQKEADLLKFLCENPNKTLKREEILFHVWGKDDYFLGRSMDVFFTKIRRNFSQVKGIEIITYHGIGFKFIVP